MFVNFAWEAVTNLSLIPGLFKPPVQTVQPNALTYFVFTLDKHFEDLNGSSYNAAAWKAPRPLTSDTSPKICVAGLSSEAAF